MIFTQPVTKPTTSLSYTRRNESWIGRLALVICCFPSVLRVYRHPIWTVACGGSRGARSGKSIKGILRNLWNNMLVCFNYANAIQPKSASRRRVYRRTDRLRHRSGRQIVIVALIPSLNLFNINHIKRLRLNSFLSLSLFPIYHLLRFLLLILQFYSSNRFTQNILKIVYADFAIVVKCIGASYEINLILCSIVYFLNENVSDIILC